MKRRLAWLLLLAMPWLAVSVSNAADRVITPSGTIELFLRQGKIIEVDQPLYSVFVADPTIADVMLQSPQSVYIFGKAIGDTTIFLADETGKVVFGRNVHVTHNVDLVERDPGVDVPGHRRGGALDRPLAGGRGRAALAARLRGHPPRGRELRRQRR